MNGREHLDRYLSAWATLDPDHTAALYSVDAMMVDPTLAEPRLGREAIRAYFRDLFGSLDQPERELLDWTVSGNRVWFEWAFSTGGVRRTGASIQTVEDGLIVHDTAYWNPSPEATT